MSFKEDRAKYSPYVMIGWLAVAGTLLTVSIVKFVNFAVEDGLKFNLLLFAMYMYVTMFSGIGVIVYHVLARIFLEKKMNSLGEIVLCVFLAVFFGVPYIVILIFRTLTNGDIKIHKSTARTTRKAKPAQQAQSSAYNGDDLANDEDAIDNAFSAVVAKKLKYKFFEIRDLDKVRYRIDGNGDVLLRGIVGCYHTADPDTEFQNGVPRDLNIVPGRDISGDRGADAYEQQTRFERILMDEVAKALAAFDSSRHEYRGRTVSCQLFYCWYQGKSFFKKPRKPEVRKDVDVRLDYGSLDGYDLFGYAFDVEFGKYFNKRQRMYETYLAGKKRAENSIWTKLGRL